MGWFVFAISQFDWDQFEILYGMWRSFPTLGQLSSLRVLDIDYMVKVRSIGSEFYSYSDGSYRNTSTLFPALRILKLQYMFGLEEWKYAKELRSAGKVLVFPCLEELTLFSVGNWEICQTHYTPTFPFRNWKCGNVVSWGIWQVSHP